MNKAFRVVSLLIYVSIVLYAGCSGSDDPGKVDCSTSDLALTFDSTDPESCVLTNGTITVVPAGGKEPYTFALNAGAFGATSQFTQLSAGDYIVRVKDKNGCMVETDEIQLRIPGGDLTATASAEPDTECVGNNGTITITAAGGTQPYTYKIGTGAFGTNAAFTSLAPGNYTVTVQDAEGCLFPKPATVSRGDTGTSLSGDIQPIINTNCAIPNCHNGSQSPNLSSLSGIRSNAAGIKAQTQSGAMPKEGSITAAEKALIACWVDDGAKDN
jgi:hypothetical protein